MEFGGRRVIDLTHPLHPRMPVAIGFPRLMLTRYLDRAAGDVAAVEIPIIEDPASLELITTAPVGFRALASPPAASGR